MSISFINTKFAIASKISYELLLSTSLLAEDAWIATVKEIVSSKPSQNKNCPKHTFIGLCESGDLKDIEETKKSTNINYQYAKYAIDQWKENPDITINEMWQIVYAHFGRAKNHNGQLHVALALKEYWV